MLLTLLQSQGAPPIPPEPDGASRGGYAFPRPKQFRPPKRQLPKSLYDDDDVAITLALALLT